MPTPTPTISATVLGGLPEFILANFGRKELNIAYEASGIPVGLAAVQHAFIPETSLATFLETAARLAGEHQLGLIMAPHLTMDPQGIMADYVRASDSLGEGLKKFMGLLRYHASHDIMTVQLQGDKVKWTYKYASAETFGYSQVALGTIGVQINLLREFFGPNWLPDRIELDIPKPPVVSLFEQIYPCQIIFDAPEIGHVFDRDLLKHARHWKMERPVTASDVKRSRLKQAPSGLLGVTTNIIKSQILTSKVSLDGAARLLGLSNRTLQRELDQLGMSFRELTKKIRMNRAGELLRETNMPITAIATELGYSSHSHFTRAYRRDHEMSPGQFRKIWLEGNNHAAFTR